MNHRQEEGNLLPKQAYLDILDVKSTIEKNWKLFDKQLHDVWWTSGKAGVTFPPGMLPVLKLGYGYSERGHHGKKALYS